MSSSALDRPAGAVLEPAASWRARLLVSHEYSWLWFAQVISAFGDWVGLFAITALAADISGQPEAATALVLTARVPPSFFIGPFMGVLVDRYDRRTLMRIADLARACVFVALPFVRTLWGLILASLLLEIFTLLWSPAKEALVPSLVARERLTTANSLGVLAAYGTMPLAGALVYGLKEGNDALAKVSWLDPFQFSRGGNTQALAFYFDALTFLATALIVWGCIQTSGAPRRGVGADGVAALAGVRKAIDDIRTGWRFIFENRVVRAVNLGLAAGLLGGAMLVPLGPTFAKYVIGDSNAFSLYITAMGIGVAIGVAALTAWQQRIPKERVFVSALLFAGVSILFGVSMSTFWLSAVGVFGLGLGAGAVYILGYTLIQEHTDDDLRGRTFTTFLTLVRLCVLGAMVLGPAISAGLDPLMERLIDGRAARGMPGVRLLGVDYGLPGVRVTLWFGGVLILVASVIAGRSVEVRVRGNLRRIGGARVRAR
jgi:dTMP kinase